MTVLKKKLFHIPKNVIYLDGNSLGPLPKSVNAKVSQAIENEWGEQMIVAWNEAGWVDLPLEIGNQIAPLIGAPKNSVVIGDTLSIKVFQALASALKIKSDRKVILSDCGNFPTDLYMAQGLIELLNNGYTLKIVEPSEVEDSINQSVAVMMITEVDYRTGRKHDVKKLTKKAHQMGAMSLIDLAHSAGAIEVDVLDSNCDFAVGCTYKYLNGGPGAPAFIYIREDIVQDCSPALAGWFGHQSPFAFDLKYQPAMNIERMRVGTPPIIQMISLKEALKVWNGVDIKLLRQKSIELCELFIQEVEKISDEWELISPRDSNIRGSQVSFTFDYGYEMIQALIQNGVIGDYRAPNVMRFGFTPLYIDENDVIKAVQMIKKIYSSEAYKDAKYKKINKVT